MISEKLIKKIRLAFNGNDQRAMFKNLGDTNRYRIFEMLSTNPQLMVSDIAKILKISIPLASQHLKVLEQGDILEKEKIGQKVFYKLKKGNILAQALIDEVI